MAGITRILFSVSEKRKPSRVHFARFTGLKCIKKEYICILRCLSQKNNKAWHVRKELQYYLYESGTDTDLHFHFRFYFQFLSRFLIWVKFDEHLYFFQSRDKLFSSKGISLKFVPWAKSGTKFLCLPAGKEKGFIYFDYTGTTKQ